jgi:hypothetical protein
MFHIPTLCERRAERAMARVSETCFGVHFFVGNAIVNSPLHCCALDAEREWLCKSLCARLNTLCTVARRACGITRSNCRGISFSSSRLLVASPNDGFGFSIFGFALARVATSVYSAVACSTKMQRHGRLLHVATAAARWRLRQRQRARSSYGARREWSRPGAVGVWGFAAPMFRE